MFHTFLFPLGDFFQYYSFVIICFHKDHHIYTCSPCPSCMPSQLSFFFTFYWRYSSINILYSELHLCICFPHDLSDTLGVGWLAVGWSWAALARLGWVGSAPCVSSISWSAWACSHDDDRSTSEQIETCKASCSKLNVCVPSEFIC